MSVKLTYNGKDYQNEIVAEGGRVEMTHAMVGETLSADSLTVPVTTGGRPIRLLATDQGEDGLFMTADNEILCLDSDDASAPEYIKNSPGLLYFDNSLLVKHYLHQVNRRSGYEYEMMFYSAVWLLDQSDHVGGLYTGETAEVILGEILSNIVTYAIDDDIKDIQIYGYLPYDKRRNNLMKVLMAIGAALNNASDGSLRITQLSDVVTGVFDEERVYLGGTVSETPPATAVQVTEHNYLPSEEEVPLFDDSTVGTETVIFTEPYHDITIDNGTIVSSGVNYCTFSATGYVTLTGKRYNHVTRIVTVGDAPAGTESDTVRRVTDNTLLTPSNAIYVAEKLYDYLTKSQIIRQDIIVGTERPGDVVSVINPYTKEMVDACIKSMSVQFGKSRLKANCEFLIDYIPPGATVGFEHYTLLAGTGEWTVPEGVTKIRVIEIEPGSSGNPGGNGQNGTTSSAGAGGNPGVGGPGGKILEINLSVTPLSVKEYACGEHTVFDGISAATGRSYPYGYTEPKSGLVLGKNGLNGIAGGGGIPIGGTVTKDGVTYYPGPNGSSASGGGVVAYGGGGGGAASGGNGGTGQNGTVSQSGGYYLWFPTSFSYDPATSKSGYSDYSFNPSTGVISNSGSYITITPSGTLDDVYVISGTSITWTRNHDGIGNRLGYLESRTTTRTGSALTYTRYYGGGGDGAPGGSGEDATGYGEGGHGGDGGGGGGQSNGYENARTGIGGQGGPGGSGGPGCIIIYY